MYSIGLQVLCCTSNFTSSSDINGNLDNIDYSFSLQRPPPRHVPLSSPLHFLCRASSSSSATAAVLCCETAECAAHVHEYWWVLQYICPLPEFYCLALKTIVASYYVRSLQKKSFCNQHSCSDFLTVTSSQVRPSPCSPWPLPPTRPSSTSTPSTRTSPPRTSRRRTRSASTRGWPSRWWRWGRRLLGVHAMGNSWRWRSRWWRWERRIHAMGNCQKFRK